MAQSTDCFFFDLAYTFPCQTEFFADFFQCHFLSVDPEKQFNNIALPLGQCRQCPFHFSGQ